MSAKMFNQVFVCNPSTLQSLDLKICSAGMLGMLGCFHCRVYDKYSVVTILLM